jgi:hypothetical protein
MSANIALSMHRQFKAEIMAKLLAATLDREDLEASALGLDPELRDVITGASHVANAIIAQAKIRDELG